MSEKPVLVVNARGKTGRRVAHRLEESGRTVRRGSRAASDTVVDLADAESWDAALTGVGAVYLVPMSGELPATPEAIAGFTARAGAAGVDRIVLLSVRGARGRIDPAMAPIEDAVRAGGPEWTIVRPSWFAQNFSEGLFLEELLAGALAAPVGDGREAFIDVEDVADVVTAALTDGDRHAGAVYELSGPDSLTFAEAVAAISRASGEPMDFVAVDRQDYLDGAIAAGLPEEVASVVVELFDGIRAGNGDYLSDGVRQALGRAPASFDRFVHAAVADGAWRR